MTGPSVSARVVDLGAIADPAAQRMLAFCRAQKDRVLLVGGCVRDLLLGRATHDYDLVVPRSGLELARRMANDLGGAFLAIDAGRDVGRALLYGDDGKPIAVDIAAWRAGSLEEDLRLRDFSINSLAAPVGDVMPVVIDVVGGLADLDGRVLRATSPRAFADDPLRTLRAVRMLAELAPWGFRLDAATAEQVRHAASSLPSCSAERMRDELVRMLASEQPDRWIQLLADLGLLAEALPEVAELRGVGQSHPHRWDVFEHTLQALAHVAWLQAWLARRAIAEDPMDAALADALAPYRDRLAAHFAQGEGGELRNRAHLLRWTALCHDLGKPATRSVKRDERGQEERVQFIGHELRGADLTQQMLRRLRLNEYAVRRVSTVVASHMRPLLLANETQSPSARAVFRYFRDLGDAGVDAALFSLSDVRATADESTSERWRSLVGVVRRLLQDYFDRAEERVSPPALVDGNDLMAALGLPPGKSIGRLLAAVAEAQAAGEVHTAHEALQYAARAVGHAGPTDYTAADPVVTQRDHPRGT